MPFFPTTIALYSVGLLGGSIGSGLKASGYSGRILGLSSTASIQKALSLGCIDEGRPYDALKDVIAEVDCLFLCSPIRTIIHAIETLGSMSLPPGLMITDVGSTKSEVMAAASRALPSSVHFIGGHPMAGSEKSGVSASDPFLFQNAMYLLTPQKNTPAELVADFAAFLERLLGCRHLILDCAVHDRVVAAVSHVPHLLAVALVNLAQKAEDTVPGTLKLAAGGFRDMTRIASAPYRLWHDILLTNKNSIRPLIEEFRGILGELETGLMGDTLEPMFENAVRTRGEIPVGNKGFITEPNDILVVARDQPGIIAELSTALAREHINIKDIEVLKVREGEAGTIRLAFESKTIARKAVSVLTGVGFIARERN
jgi:Prephenate dehydrogenase